MIKKILLQEYKKYKIYANACIVIYTREKEIFTIERVTAVNLKDSKCLQTMTNDKGIVVYNENDYGFFVNWKDYEEFKKKLKIKEDECEEFLDNFIDDLINTVIDHIKGS
jgi:hypothetical protein